MKPLADLVRPTELSEVVGQKHILGDGMLLSKIIKSNHATNMIFYGPPGTGKTTVANIIAKATDKKLYKLNATDASTKDVRKIVDELGTLFTNNGVLLYLDEIQNFNKKQQQTLLKHIESGEITLISSTTENPYFTIFHAILSRSTIFEFKKIDTQEVASGLKRAIGKVENNLNNREIRYDEDALEYIASVSNGDMRRALNDLEIAIYSNINNNDFVLNMDIAKECTQTSGFSFDKFGDSHYDTLSAFQKSIRGSDVDASLHYLARLVRAGDLKSVCRRLLVIASEDIGLAYPSAITVTNSCVEAALKVGFPEARIHLAQAVILLANSPKSNSAIMAIDKALADIKESNIGDIPNHLKDAHYKGASKLGRGVEYLYPHNYPNNYVKQQYLPSELKNKRYYKAGNNTTEKKFENYMNEIKK